MKNELRRVLNLFSAFMLLLLSNPLKAQITLTEGFESTTFPPAGWTLSSIGGAGFNYWGRFNTGTFPVCLPHSGTAMARFNSRTPALGSTQTLFSPAFDLSNVGVDTARVTFWVHRNDSSATATVDYDSLEVLINTTASELGAVAIGTIARDIRIALPDTQAVAGWYQYTFDIPATFNGSVNHVLFRGTKQSATNSGYRIFVDDIQYDAYPAPCSGLPTAGVVSGSDTLFCTSGVVTLQMAGASANLPGLEYQWQFADSSGGAYTNFGAGALTQVSDTLFASRIFRCVTICTLTNDSAFSNEWAVRVDTAAPVILTLADDSVTYCTNNGIPAMLVASGAEFYSWTPTQGLSSTFTDTVYASPFFSTTYTVTGTNAAGCSDIATVRVSVGQTPNVNLTTSATLICTGDSVTLTATATGGGFGGQLPSTFTWSPFSITGNSVRVGIDSLTTVVVTATSLLGCTGPASIDSVVIDVTAVPAAGIISASDTVICGGPAPVDLSSGATSVGVFEWFESVDLAGSWTPLGLQGSTVTTDTIIQPTYYIAVASCPNGNADTSNVIFVNISTGPPPAVSLNSVQSYYCQAANPVLLVASGALFYDWTPATGLNSTFTDSVYAAPLQSTTYLVTGFDSLGCSDTATVRVSVRPNPNVSVAPSAITLCEGDSVTLSANATNVGPGGTMTYSWDGVISNQITITPASAGIYQVIVVGTSNFGCSNANSIDTSFITVEPLPTASFSYVISSDTVYFSSATSNISSVNWDFGDGTSSGDSVVAHVYTNGTYTVVFTAEGTCGTITDSVQITINVTSVDEVSTMNFGVYPNPATEWVEVVSNLALDRVELLDLSGRIVQCSTVRSNLYRERIALDTLESGVYVIRAIGAKNELSIQRLVIR
ncbi:MAG: PKD domain-containing protein [Sphingobacteriales bacterium]|nr:PKD domain-containing protein [Sphingobacteriales bacterium]